MAPRRSTKSAALRLLPLLFPLGALAFDCTVVREGFKFDLRPLRGEHAITVHKELGENAYNTTWTTNLCAPIKKKDNVPANQQCPSGTRICGVKYFIDRSEQPAKTRFEHIVSVAGNLANNHIDEVITRLNKSSSNADERNGGLRLELHGGIFSGVKQTAIIDLICDPDRTGWEGQDDGKTAPGEGDDVINEGTSMRTTRRDQVKPEVATLDVDKKGDAEKKPAERSLTFVSYDEETLKLRWRTQYACEKAQDTPDKGGDNSDEPSKGSWGFFTWLVIILFLGIAAYLIFGSWLNYNRYGARGTSRPSTALSNAMASSYKPLPVEKPEISITPPSDKKSKPGDIHVQVYSPYSPSSSSSVPTPIDRV